MGAYGLKGEDAGVPRPARLASVGNAHTETRPGRGGLHRIARFAAFLPGIRY